MLDVESGSVGSALVRLEPNEAPHIISEFRAHGRIPPTRSAEILADSIERLAREAFIKASEVAARLRHSGHGALGTVSSIETFLSPPWGRPNLAAGRPDFLPHMQERLQREAQILFDTPMSFYTAAGAATGGLRAVAPFENDYLLCIATHEMTELLRIHNGQVVGHATIPHGINLPLRTLRTHAGLTQNEARRAMGSGHEALSPAAEHFANEFREIAPELFAGRAPERAWVVSHAGDFFAKVLSHESISDLFPEGGIVRALAPHHAHQKLKSPSQDVFLTLEALFIGYI